MQNKKFKRLGAAILTAAMVLQSIGSMAPVSAAETTQMSSEKEVVYANVYSDTAREQDFNDNWKFYLGDASGAESANFDDSAWENVNVPHDYSIEQEYTSAGEAESGYLLGGTGWYRKHFTLASDLEGKEIRIDFGGVYMNATVWVNGTKLGTHPFGYTPFSFNITDYVEFGAENVITVKVDHQTPSSRWYSGSGIYRSVNLTVTDAVHVDLYGTRVDAPNLEEEQNGTVNVTVDTTVANAGDAAASVVLTHTIYEKGTEESIGTVTTAAKSVAAGAEAEIEANLPAEKPALWDLENPNLYTIVTEVEVNGKVVDTYETEYGFRYVKFDTETGFYLNGEPVKLKGVCMHHDQGSLGSEAHYRAIERQVEILQEMGCNSIRVTHNPAADELIEICNEKGILVIDEFFDGWMYAKNGNYNDYSVWFQKQIEDGNEILGAEDGMTWAEFDLKATIGRGENAPSVIMWSLGNEIQEGAGGSGYHTMAAKLIDWCQEMETTKILTIGSNAVKNGGSEHVDIANQLTAVGGASGTNYSNGSSYDSLHKSYPDWYLYGSETASHVNSRGVYNVTGSQQLNADKALTSYDYSAVGWGATASSAWYDVITRDFVAGEYVWTGFDYLGEPTPNNGTGTGWVNGTNSPKNSFFGIIDTAGLPKDNYYFYQSQWNDEVNTLHVLPAWNEDVLATPSNVPVVVYSDAASVKLTLTKADGTVKDLGTKQFYEKTTAAGYTYQMASETSTNHRDMYLTWYVPFEEGTITATAYDKAGNVITDTVGRSYVTTTGDEAKLEMTVDRDVIAADGDDLAYFTVNVTDEDGNIVPDASNNVTFTVEGDGVLVGVDNGKQSDHQSFQDDNRDAFSGSLIAIVQSTKEAGEFTVTATSAGLESASVTVTTESTGSGGDVSFLMSKNYYVKVGNAPQLPAAIETTLADGTVKELAVKWNDVAAEDYAEAGTFAVAGVVDGKYSVSVTVNMIDEVGGLLNYSATTAAGVVPTLPTARQAVLLDGTILDAAFPVAWEAIDEADCAKEGTFVVTGTADVFGSEVTVTAAIRVQEAEVSVGESITYQAVKLYQDIEEDLQSDTLAAIMDGSTAVGANTDGGANETAWTNYDASQAGDTTAEIVFGYDTQQRFAEIVVHFFRDGYAAEYPDAGTTKFYVSETGADGSWTEIDATESIGTENGNVKPYTYSFDAVSATYVKVAITNSTAAKTAKTCTGITEVELKKAITGGMNANSSTGLSALRVNGVNVSASEIATGNYYTMDETAVVRAAGKDNAAVTVLPQYQNTVTIITEAEDHTSRELFVIFLGMERPATADDDSRDVDTDSMSVYAEDYQPNYAGEGDPKYVLDGDTGTIWHTVWSGSTRDTHYLIFTFDEVTAIDGMRFMQRSGRNGNVKTFDLLVRESEDDEWTTIVDNGSLNSLAEWQLVSFAAVDAKQVKFQVVDADSDQTKQFAAAAEVRFTHPTSGSGSGSGAVDKSVLAEVMQEADTYKAEDYTAESFAAFEGALAAAKLAAESDLTQEEVNAIVAALDEAILGLEKVAAVETPEPTPEVKEDVTDVFDDVYADWYVTYVQYVYDNALMTGIKGTNNFEPNANITKAQVAQVLYNMEGQPAVTDMKVFAKLNDVYAAEWYANAVAWAFNTGVVTGDLNTMKFNPNADVTREQLALMMYRYADFKGYDVTAESDLAGLANAENTSNWAADGVKWAVGAGLISGIDKGTVKDLAPQGNASRAQMAAILQRFCENVK